MSAMLKQKLIDIANGFTKYGLWKGGSETLSDLNDVTLTNLQKNDVLTYNGSEWVNDDNLQTQINTLNSNLVNIDAELLNYTDVTGHKNSFVNNGSAFSYSKTGNKVVVQCYGSVNADVSMNVILCANFPEPSFGYGVLTIVNLSTGTSASCVVNSLGQLCTVEAILSSGNEFAISGSYICKL